MKTISARALLFLFLCWLFATSDATRIVAAPSADFRPPAPPTRALNASPKNASPKNASPAKTTFAPHSSTRTVAPSSPTFAVSNVASNAIQTRQLAPQIVQNLELNGVWIDPSLSQTTNAAAIEKALHNADFSVRVLIARRLPPNVQNVDALAEMVHQQLKMNDGLAIVATSDDAQLGIYGGDLNAATRRQIVLDGAQTWTQEGYAAGVAQTLRLTAYERKLQAWSRFWRIVLPGTIGVLCLLAAFAIWLRRKLKHRARRVLSKSLPTTIPVLNDDATPIETPVESSTVEAV